MKGLISYAHDDITMFGQFRQHLFATEQAFDIQLWADERIEAGHHWDEMIQQAISRAELFILLLSPAYIASKYIREREIPAIATRSAACNGLVCPVVLKPCAWESVLGHIQAVPTRGRRLLPIIEWQPQDRGYHEARAQIEAAIRSHFKLLPKANQWFSPLIGFRDEQPGPVWVEVDEQFTLDPSGGESDIAAVADGIVVQLHRLNRQKAEAFANKVFRLSNVLGVEWDELIPAAGDLYQPPRLMTRM